MKAELKKEISDHLKAASVKLSENYNKRPDSKEAQECVDAIKKIMDADIIVDKIRITKT